MSGSYFSKLTTAVIFTLAINCAHASVTIPMVLFDANGNSKDIGSITAEDSFCGVLLTPKLHDLPPGVHGFHVHVNPTCDEKGMAAGGHLDTANTNEHNGPYNTKGHLGDLPVLIVNQDGTATLPTLAPKFTLSQMMDHAFMIHAGGDNYSDKPEKLGGGGSRIACGVIKNPKANPAYSDSRGVILFCEYATPGQIEKLAARILLNG